MDYADYIDRTDYDSVDAVRAGIDTGAAEAALEEFYDNDLDGITENITGQHDYVRHSTRNLGPGGGSGEGRAPAQSGI